MATQVETLEEVIYGGRGKLPSPQQSLQELAEAITFAKVAQVKTPTATAAPNVVSKPSAAAPSSSLWGQSAGDALRVAGKFYKELPGKAYNAVSNAIPKAAPAPAPSAVPAAANVTSAAAAPAVTRNTTPIGNHPKARIGGALLKWIANNPEHKDDTELFTDAASFNSEDHEQLQQVLARHGHKFKGQIAPFMAQNQALVRDEVNRALKVDDPSTRLDDMARWGIAAFGNKATDLIAQRGVPMMYNKLYQAALAKYPAYAPSAPAAPAPAEPVAPGGAAAPAATPNGAPTPQQGAGIAGFLKNIGYTTTPEEGYAGSFFTNPANAKFRWGAGGLGIMALLWMLSRMFAGRRQ